MIWQRVSRRHQTHGLKNGVDATTPAWVNMDRVDAIEPLPDGGARLIWHGSIPRIEWMVDEQAAWLVPE